MPCQERNGQLCKFCENHETNSAPLEDHIPTLSSYLISIISLGVKRPPMTVDQATSSLEHRLSDCLKEVY